MVMETFSKYTAFYHGGFLLLFLFFGITYSKEDFGGKSYPSTRLKTEGKASWRCI